MLQLGKESLELIEVQGMYNEDVRSMEEGFSIGNVDVKGNVHTMYDRKASDILGMHRCML